MISFIKKKIAENKDKLLIHYKSFFKGILVTFGGIMWGTLLIVNTKPNQKIQLHQITDEGGWLYSSTNGDLRINCTHKDSKGIPFYEW